MARVTNSQVGVSNERVEDTKERLRRIDVPSPNPALAEWLMGPESRAEVERVTAEIYTAYVRRLPVRTGNLKAGAYMRVDVGGWGADQDRWFGYVGNSARSYRPRRGYLYGRFIEYGKPSRGIPGQYHLHRAAQEVARGLGDSVSVNIPGTFRDSRGRLRDRRGRFVRDPLRRRNR